MLAEGDLIYLLDDRGKRFWTVLQRGMIKIPGLGVVDGQRITGRQSGSRLTVGGKDFWLLKPTANELMDSLDRGPQVITAKDAATIAFRLGIRCGDTVIEGGLGSGALTLALLNAVGPSGKVISVELRGEHAQKAEKNIARAGFKNWELLVGDVKTVRIKERASAVSLDIPDPWAALRNVESFLETGGRLAAYVPNMNQVEATVKALREHGYIEIQALENIQRNIEVHPGGVRPAYETLGHTGYLVFATKTAEGLLPEGVEEPSY